MLGAGSTGGGGAGTVTVSVAALLVALPAEFVTVTWKLEPLLDAAVAGVV